MKVLVSALSFLSAGLLTGFAAALDVRAAGPDNLSSIVESLSAHAAKKGIDVDAIGRRFLQEAEDAIPMEDLAETDKKYKYSGEDVVVNPSHYDEPVYKKPDAGCSCSKEFMQRVRNGYRESVNGVLLSLHVFCDDKDSNRRLEGGEVEGGEAEVEGGSRLLQMGDSIPDAAADEAGIAGYYSYTCPTYTYPVPHPIKFVLEITAWIHYLAVKVLAKLDCAGCVDKDHGYTYSYQKKETEIAVYDCCCDADSIKDIVENFYLSTIAQMHLYFISPHLYKYHIYSLLETAAKSILTIAAPYGYYPTRAEPTYGYYTP